MGKFKVYERKIEWSMKELLKASSGWQISGNILFFVSTGATILVQSLLLLIFVSNLKSYQSFLLAQNDCAKLILLQLRSNQEKIVALTEFVLRLSFIFWKEQQIHETSKNHLCFTINNVLCATKNKKFLFLSPE